MAVSPKICLVGLKPDDMKDTKAADAILAPVCLVFERFCFSRFAHHPEANWPDTLAWGLEAEMYVVWRHLHM
ncbi:MULTISPECIES: hypothetical protein [unclassified Ruegeria]|uniref:hypothetical protein n=1 Tax=unclassified Ruegeria TaxID=2625375 RepID=UPI00148772C0|nr:MULTISPECIES: hypothetical protein [unclassified Ruegeria]NOD64850.1 hypothetical protein [Ruegeria sp. HKCCD6109]